MADTVALQILQAVKTRLDDISVANGYNTDPTTVIGVQSVNPDQVAAGPVVSIYEVDDNPTEDQTFCQQHVIELSIIIEAVVQYGATPTSTILSRIWQDIMKAVFLDDTTLGGLALGVARGSRTFEYPPPGGETVAVRQTVNVQYLETYGNP